MVYVLLTRKDRNHPVARIVEGEYDTPPPGGPLTAPPGTPGMHFQLGDSTLHDYGYHSCPSSGRTGFSSSTGAGHSDSSTHRDIGDTFYTWKEGNTYDEDRCICDTSSFKPSNQCTNVKCGVGVGDISMDKPVLPSGGGSRNTKTTMDHIYETPK